MGFCKSYCFPFEVSMVIYLCDDYTIPTCSEDSRMSVRWLLNLLFYSRLLVRLKTYLSLKYSFATCVAMAKQQVMHLPNKYYPLLLGTCTYCAAGKENEIIMEYKQTLFLRSSVCKMSRRLRNERKLSLADDAISAFVSIGLKGRNLFSERRTVCRNWPSVTSS